MYTLPWFFLIFIIFWLLDFILFLNWGGGGEIFFKQIKLKYLGGVGGGGR